MDLFFKGVAIFLLLNMLLVLIRVIKGPTVLDRLVGVNVIGTKSIVLLIIIGILFERASMFVDIALGYGLLNYIASIAAAKYFHHHKTMHPESQWKSDLKESN